MEVKQRQMGVFRWHEYMSSATMVAVTVAFGVMNSMIKMAIKEGMDLLVFLVLRHLVATLLLAPIAYFHERSTRPNLTASIFAYLFFSALLGGAATQFFFLFGLQYTSTTYATAFLNMAPAFTFLLTLLIRLETLNLREAAGAAKALGTLLCIGGAVLMMFYRGAMLTNSSFSHQSILPQTDHSHNCIGIGKRMIGSAALLTGTISWSSWFVLQSKTIKKYPALYSCTAYIFFLAFLQGSVVRFATQKNFSPWILKKKFEIFTVLFSGLVGSGLGFLAMSWCVEKRGPVFTSAFTPLIEVVAAVIDFFILHETLHLGSILGSVVVIGGLYMLLWGKSREERSSLLAKQMQESDERQQDRQFVTA